jgi:hypothetical protein
MSLTNVLWGKSKNYARSWISVKTGVRLKGFGQTWIDTWNFSRTGQSEEERLSLIYLLPLLLLLCRDDDNWWLFKYIVHHEGVNDRAKFIKRSWERAEVELWSLVQIRFQFKRYNRLYIDDERWAHKLTKFQEGTLLGSLPIRLPLLLTTIFSQNLNELQTAVSLPPFSIIDTL